ncbi:hypothetical protein RHGRI_030762 [Rhododendron griersonianum]|uniref:Uncharacterized protein n=1 Tax=Rhododendron griersonianum TaxID=479676 RepID=A0AAV6I5L8_9ERIC|nr:hypothetical protein RHGRI_030762 [Rhododendron griersonianum]
MLQAINPLELAMEALKEIQLQFYRDFPPHPKEEVYGFATPSTMKPTQWSLRECRFDVLILYSDNHFSITDVMKKLQEYVEDLNANIEKLDVRGPVSKYVLPDEHLRGRLAKILIFVLQAYEEAFLFWYPCLQFTLSYFSAFQSKITISYDEAMNGVACNLDSRGFHVLCKATEEAVGHVKPYSITGSLPLIRELQQSFDVGLMATYHAKNEYCLLSDMGQGYQVFASIICQLED